MAMAPVEPKPPDPHHLTPSCSHCCFFCSLSSDFNRNYVLSRSVDSGRRDLGKRNDPWVFATAQLLADSGMKLIDSTISFSESLSTVSGRVFGELSEKPLRSVEAVSSTSRIDAQLRLLSPSPRVFLSVFPSLAHRISSLTCEGECYVLCLSKTTKIASARWDDTYDYGWMLNVPNIDLLVSLCCTMSWFTGILLNCECCVVVWLWFSPSSYWMLLLGNYCHYLLYVWVQACCWMRMVCKSCVYRHDNDLMCMGLGRLSGLTLVFLFGRLLLWSPVVSWLFCLALWNRSLFMIGYVNSYSQFNLINDNMWKFWSASYFWLAYCDYVRSVLPVSGGHVSSQRPGCADRISVIPFFGLLITDCNLRHLHHLSRFWLGVCLTDSSLVLLLPNDRTTPLCNVVCNNYLMQWCFEFYLGVIMPREHPSCSWFEVLCRSSSAIVSVADEDLQRGGVVLGVELCFLQCKQLRRSSLGPLVVTKCAVDVGSHQEVLARIRCAGQRRLDVCIRSTRALVSSGVADLSMNGCIVIMYCSFNVKCSLYFLMALSIMFVVDRVRCIISHPVSCIYGCRIPSIIICNSSSNRILEQHYRVLGLCSMALDGHPWMLSPAHDGCCLIRCCMLMHSYRSFEFQLWTIVASSSAMWCSPIKHLL